VLDASTISKYGSVSNTWRSLVEFHAVTTDDGVRKKEEKPAVGGQNQTRISLTCKNNRVQAVITDIHVDSSYDFNTNGK